MSTSSSVDRMLLEASNPREWLETHLPNYFEHHYQEVAAGRASVELTVPDLLANDGARVRDMFDRQREEGVPGPAAATSLVGSLGGLAATTVGFSYVASGAGFLLERGNVVYQQHPDGWTEAVEIEPPSVVVKSDHPWAGRPDVEVLERAEQVEARILGSLVETVRPLVEACHRLTRVGRAGLWNEVGDGLGVALVFQTLIPSTLEAVAAIGRLLTAPDVPWRRSPIVRAVATDFGHICVMQRGGCCLAYTMDFGDDHEDDVAHRLFDQTFPDEPGTRHYCADCSLRSYEDCEARQVWWRTYEHSERAQLAEVVS